MLRTPHADVCVTPVRHRDTAVARSARRTPSPVQARTSVGRRRGSVARARSRPRCRLWSASSRVVVARSRGGDLGLRRQARGFELRSRSRSLGLARRRRSPGCGSAIGSVTIAPADHVVEDAPDAFERAGRRESLLRKARVHAHVHAEQTDVGTALALRAIDLRLRDATRACGFEHIRRRVDASRIEARSRRGATSLSTRSSSASRNVSAASAGMPSRRFSSTSGVRPRPPGAGAPPRAAAPRHAPCRDRAAASRPVRRVTEASVSCRLVADEQLLGHRQRPNSRQRPRRTRGGRPRPASARRSAAALVRSVDSRDRRLRRGRSCRNRSSGHWSSTRVWLSVPPGSCCCEKRQRRIRSEGRLLAHPRATSICVRAARSDGSCSSARAIASSSVSPPTGSTYGR